MSSVQPDFEFDQSATGQERRIKDLPTFYYHGHFVEMLDFVERHYSHVLEQVHDRFLKDFRALPHRAQCLYVRLFNRKGIVFSTSRLRYPELGDMEPLLQELRERDWVGVPSARHFDGVLTHMTRSRIRDALQTQFAGLGGSMKKAALIEFARVNCDPESFVASVCDDTIFVQRRSDVVAYLSFLFFGRLQDGLDRFTMRDLGLVRVHDFRDSFEPRFNERDEALEHYFFAAQLKRVERADPHTLLQLADEAQTWPRPVWPAAASDRDRLAFRVGRKLEQSGDTDRAITLYSLGESTRCSERVVRLLLKDQRRDEARQFLERCLDCPRSDEEWLYASDLYERKFNKKRTSDLTDRLRAAVTIDLDESMNGNPERAVADYFEQHGCAAFRTENGLWCCLFGLLFWPQLFGSGNKTLHSPFEFIPSNLDDGRFAMDHAVEIGERLALLHDKAALKHQLLKISSRYYGTNNGVFRWRRNILDAVFAFVDAAPAAAMQTMLRRFCENFREARYGYPDLLLLDQQGARFVEVKNDGDTLRRNQLLRLQQLEAAGFRADIARIRWTLDPEQTYVVVDIETTGGRGEHHRVTELAAVKLRAGKRIATFATLLNPQRSIPAGITRLTGISADMVADAPYFSDIADEFAEFMGDAIFVAHNVDFDYRFIAAEYRRIGRQFRHPKLCTCASMRKLYPGHRSYSLNALCGIYDIPLTAHHRALCDAEAATELLLLVNEKRAELLSD